VRVWVTRAQPGAQATAARLRALGHEPVVAPLLEVRPIPGAAIDLEGVGAVAFTSANAVRVFAGLSPERDLPVFAVGEATAAAARAAGFSAVTAGPADVAALAEVIRGASVQGLVLHPSAREVAGDLSVAGAPLRRVAIYETAAVSARPGDVDAVLVHSPKAARRLASTITPAEAASMTAFVLSAACAEPLSRTGFLRLAIASAPTEAELLALLAG
jgi:uroporphyrinogen-III synthase